MLALAMSIISQIACGKIHTTLSVVLLAACAANLALLCAFL
ncbi:glucose transporter [Bradyrhizobium sp.]|nr:glucose transporter [Bradyrhizobium sp.]HZR77397.1 glucose transporter [Bradyrhizobium sp.]